MLIIFAMALVRELVQKEIKVKQKMVDKTLGD